MLLCHDYNTFGYDRARKKVFLLQEQLLDYILHN